MKKLLIAAILFSACGSGNDTKPFTKDTAKQIIAEAPEHPVIGKPQKLGSLEIAGNDFPEQMIWDQAKISCEALGTGWRLPTKEELHEIYLKKDSIGGFTINLYWSSSETDSFNVSTKNFSNGKEGRFSKIYRSSVRAVRTF